MEKKLLVLKPENKAFYMIETDAADASEMKKIEIIVLKKLGLSNPYIV